MARAARATENEVAESGPVTEAITYVPGSQDPVTVKWCGHVFHANVPKDITGNADGNDRDRLNAELIERARDNKHFKVGSGRGSKREAVALPKTPDQYRAHMIAWLLDESIRSTDQLVARFAQDRELQATCEVGADDWAYLSTLFMPKLHELAKADELTEAQVAHVWINHGINQLPW